jgi:hypothetical protein
MTDTVDWIENRLEVTGPDKDLQEFVMAAEGPGVVLWERPAGEDLAYLSALPTASRLRSVPVLFSHRHMPDTDPMPDPHSPEWTIAWAIKRALRLHLGKRHAYLQASIAKDVVEALKHSRWIIIRRPPDLPHSTPGE